MDPNQPAGTPQQTPPTAPQPVISPQVPGPPNATVPPPISSPSPSSGFRPSKKLIIVAAVVLVAIVGGVMLLTNKSGNPVSKIAKNITGGSDVIDRKDGTLDLSNLIDKQKTIKNQDLKAKLNQQVNLSNGTSYMVTGVERNYTSPSKYVVADAGKELISVSVVVGNRNKEGNDYIYSGDFKIKNAAGGVQDAEYVSDEEVPGSLQAQDIAPGKQAKGTLIFQVDKDEKVVLVTEDKYDNADTKESVTIKSEVTLK